MVVVWVSVILPRILISFAAHMVTLPLVVDKAPSRLMSFPAPSRTLPLVVVMSAPNATFTSRPQQTSRFPLVAVIGWLMLTFPSANNDSVVGVELAVHAMALLT